MDQRFQQRLRPAPKHQRIPERRRLRTFAGIIGPTAGAALGPAGALSVASVDDKSCNDERVVVAAPATVGPAENL